MANKGTPAFSHPRSSGPLHLWTRVRLKFQSILAPVGRFFAIEAASGIVLMTAAVLALIWANSPWRMSYLELWHIPLSVGFGKLGLERDLHFWINDGLMTLFFFVVGLEIRHEIHAGTLSEVRRAALPVAAALGGMLVPALIFRALNSGRPTAVGWAVPVATDIAFAVGALVLLGKRVSPALRILLLALAVIDDVGAIIVIALFYSTELAVAGFAVLILGILLIWAFQRLGVRSSLAYVFPGVVIWAGAYSAGIHPTLAGVILGVMTPTRLQTRRSPNVRRLRVADGEAASPVKRLQETLQGWVAFGIMPLFAFANAGVPLGQVRLTGDAQWVFWGVLLGLALGKPIGIVSLSWLAVRTRVAVLPKGVRWSHLSVVGMVGGIGFTMALFIAQLAFSQGDLLDVAKLAVLCGSLAAGIVSLLAGYRLLSPAK